MFFYFFINISQLESVAKLAGNEWLCDVADFVKIIIKLQVAKTNR